MGAFFKGWRRKMGVVSLVMACVFMAFWLRSLRTVEHITFPIGQHKLVQLISREATVAVRQIKSELAVKETSVDRIKVLGWRMHPEDSPGDLEFPVNAMSQGRGGMAYRWIMKANGFEVGGTAGRRFPVQVCMAGVPYWSVVIPVTFVSAYLLLGKTQVAKSMAFDETTVE